MRLRPYKPCDGEVIASWASDEKVFANWSGGRFGPYPITAETINRKYLEENGDCTELDNFYPMTACEEAPVGHMILRYVNGDPGTIRLGWVIVDGTRRGRGLGREMLRLALKYAFQILRAEKVTIGVFEDNIPAYRCYKGAGFRDVIQTVPETAAGRPILELEMTREEYRPD